MAIKIFIDQGHNYGNPNAGAEGNGYTEQNLVFEIGIMLRDMLNGNPEFEARTSRNSKEEILGTTNAESLKIRVDNANSWGADYFISLHANASVIESATGCEGYVYSLNSVAEAFSSSLLTGLSESTGIPGRGVFARPTLYVLRKTKMPATLIELGFITNKNEAELMYTRPDLFAQGLYNGIITYFE